MKLSKILFGAVAAAAVMGLVSCGDGIIGGGKKYTINKTNESETDIVRYYNDTAMKHAGALVKVTFKSDCVDSKSKVYGTGMMGTIFGLETKDGANTFFILSVSDKGNYYVSKFSGVTNFNAYNFGASDKADATEGTEEYEIVSLDQNVTVTLQSEKDDEDNETGKYIYLYERALVDGSYDWAILSMTDEQVEAFDIDSYSTTGSYKSYATVLKSGNIPATKTGYDEVDSESKITQKKVAVYANVYPKNTLVGEWYYKAMYKEAEVIE